MKIFIKIFLSLIIVLLCVIEAGSNTKINYTELEKEKLLKGEVIVREVPGKQKTGRTFEALGLIRASIKEIYQVLTNFEEYPEFMPNVSKVEILYSDTNRAVMNYTLGLPLKRVKKYRLDMTFEDDEVKAQIKWKMINWPGLKESETIKDTEGSQQNMGLRIISSIKAKDRMLNRPGNWAVSSKSPYRPRYNSLKKLL